MSERLKLVLLSAVEYVYLVLLWMAFVSKMDKTELRVGLVIALIGTVADAVVKAKGLGSFRPQVRYLLLTILEPWYVLKGMWVVVQCFPKAVTLARDGVLKAVQFDAGEQDAQSATRRTLATMLLTIPPDSVVIGIDGHNGEMLLHEMKPEPPSVMARQLGVQE